MTDVTTNGAPSRPDAATALSRLREMSPDLRGAAILGPGGELLAASDDGEAWGDASRQLLGAADAAGSGPAARVHVATEDGEAFALRSGDLAIVAVAERFTLASLMLFDMRSVLRDLVEPAPATAEGNS